MFTDVIILAGGFGERLWPASRPDNPKQSLVIPPFCYVFHDVLFYFMCVFSVLVVLIHS